MAYVNQSNEAAIFQLASRKDRKIAYFTAIFDAVSYQGNPIPHWPASVTFGTDPRF